jgi:hypothetical protein
VVDEENAGVELDPGEQFPEEVAERPVGGGPTPIEDTGAGGGRGGLLQDLAVEP